MRAFCTVTSVFVLGIAAIGPLVAGTISDGERTTGFLGVAARGLFGIDPMLAPSPIDPSSRRQRDPSSRSRCSHRPGPANTSPASASPLWPVPADPVGGRRDRAGGRS
jgi:hypothetical protein